MCLIIIFIVNAILSEEHVTFTSEEQIMYQKAKLTVLDLCILCE